MIVLEVISILIITLFTIACIETGLENENMGAYVVAIFLLIPLATLMLEIILK